MAKSRLDRALDFVDTLDRIAKVPGKLFRFAFYVVIPVVGLVMFVWSLIRDAPWYVPAAIGLLSSSFPLIWLGARWRDSRNRDKNGGSQSGVADVEGLLDLRYWVDEKHLMLAVDCRRVGKPVQHCRLHLLSLKPFDNGRFIVDGESGSGIVFAGEQIKPFKPKEVHLVLDRGDHFEIPVQGRQAGFLVKRWNKDFVWEARLQISANGIEPYRPKPFYFSWPPLALTDNPENEAK